jgi:heme oxygenase
MGFEDKLFGGIKAPPNAVHDKPFIAQYAKGDVTLDDHYRHLNELLAIYAVIENKLTDPSFSFSISLELQELVERKELIEADLKFLRPYVSESIKRVPLANATKGYVDYLKRLDLNDEASNDVLFAHFLVRILGDLSDGQAFKASIKTLYKEKGLGSDEGAAFYEFSEGMRKKCSKWLSSLMSGEQALYKDSRRMKIIIDAANDSITRHIKIFDELKGNPPISWCQLFTAGTATVLAVAAVGIGMALK